VTTPTSTSDSLLKFPCDFPIKVMGKNQPGFAALVTALVRHHAPDLDERQVQSRVSNGARYLALTITVRATSREQLDAIYRDLTACDEVAMAL
jgi:putative lipoic acid-binding regulatory protein